MPRKNHVKGRRPQARRGAKSIVTESFTRVGGLNQRKPAGRKRPELLPMVEATGTCPTGKIRYGSAEDAEEALKRAIINRERLNSPVREERYYPMPGDTPCACEGYHLTHTPRRAR